MSWALLTENRLITWLVLHGLPISMLVLGAIILARIVNFFAARYTARMDERFAAGSELVRTEESKHRHAVVQVISWGAIAIIYIVMTYFILVSLDVQITAFVAPATVLGAALGFGAQRIVQDLLAGFFIITEKQYGFGDVVELAVTGSTVTAEGTVEDVTLRVTRLRSSDGEVITVPNGQIVKAINLSKDWARAVIDIPLPIDTDIQRVNDLLQQIGEQVFADPHMNKLLLDTPTAMGVTAMDLEQVNVRMVARTLPGKQFEVGRNLRTRIMTTLGRAGIAVTPSVSNAGEAAS